MGESKDLLLKLNMFGGGGGDDLLCELMNLRNKKNVNVFFIAIDRCRVYTWNV